MEGLVAGFQRYDLYSTLPHRYHWIPFPQPATPLYLSNLIQNGLDHRDTKADARGAGEV